MGDEAERKKDDDGSTKGLSTQDLARMQGWVEDESRYKGTDGREWMDAAAYLEYASKRTGIMRQRNEKLAEDLSSVRGQLGSMKSQVADLIKFQGQNQARAIKNAIRDIEEQRDYAISQSDTAEVHRLDKEIDGLEEEGREVKTASDAPSGEFDAWKSRNPWYGKDLFLTVQADIEGAALAPHCKTDIELHDALDAMIAKKYPTDYAKATGKELNQETDDNEDDFGDEINTRRTRKAAVTTPRRRAEPKEKDRTFADVPELDKAQFRSQQALIPGYTEEDFMKHYDFDE